MTVSQFMSKKDEQPKKQQPITSKAKQSVAKKPTGEAFANNRFQTIAQRAPVLLWTCDKQGELTFTNDKWKAFLGVSSRRKLRDQWLAAIHHEDREVYTEAISWCLLGQRSMDVEYRITRSDGEIRWLSDSAEALADAQGRFTGLIGTMVDITDNRRHLATLRHSNEEARAHERENRLIDKMNSYLQVSLSMRETYPVMDYYLQRVFTGCSGALYLFNENKTVVEPVVSWGVAESVSYVLDPSASWALRKGKVHEVIEAGHGMLCDFLDEHPPHGYICVPVIAQGDMIGMLHIQYAQVPTDFTADEVEHHYNARRRLAIITADNLALALVSLKLREALKQQSVKDPLTQLYNRRYMSDSLEREFARCRRASWELSVILIDIDHFKRYNDEFGHDAGDLVLKELAEFIRCHMRAEDIACRFGGEEFLLLLPGAALDEAKKRAEQLREGVKQLNIRYQGARLNNIAISAGVAACPANGENETALFKASDRALYLAKQNGRDKVCVAVTTARSGEGDVVHSVVN